MWLKSYLCFIIDLKVLYESEKGLERLSTLNSEMEKILETKVKIILEKVDQKQFSILIFNQIACKDLKPKDFDNS